MAEKVKEMYHGYIQQLWMNRPGEIPALHGFRAISFLAVFLYHTIPFAVQFQLEPNRPLLTFIERLSTSVDMFFILSGYLIYGGLFRQNLKAGRISYSDFFKKRIIRIFPAYYIFQLITFGIAIIQIMEFEQKPQLSEIEMAYLNQLKDNLFRIVYDIVFVSNYLTSFQGHMWTVSTEEQFYLIMPFLLSLYVLRKSASTRMTFWIVLYFAAIVFRSLHTLSAYEGYEKDIYHFFHTRYDSLVTGILVFELVHSGSISNEFWKSPNFRRLLGIVSIFTAIFTHSSLVLSNVWLEHVFSYNFNQITFGIWMILAITSHKSFSWVNIFSSRFWIPTARLSYALYLWHVLIAVTWISKWSGKATAQSWPMFLLYLAIGLLITYIVALFSYTLVEVPSFLFRDRSKKKSKN